MAQQRIRRRQRRRGGIGGKVLLGLGAVFAVIAIAVIAITSWVLDVAADAPSLSSCKQVDKRANTTIYAADGTRLGRVISNRTRIPVSIERIPKLLQHATVAIEDQRFYEHDGVDFEGIARALRKDIEAGEAVEGGSTITQQLVRSLCLKDPERTLERKVIEAKLAEEYARGHSRQEVLGAYLNVATYGTIEGTTTVGVGAASRIYFSKTVDKLDLAQAALLAGLPQAPSEYNPILHPAAAKARRDQVLRQMAKQGYATPERARAAQRKGLGLDVSKSYFEHKQPYFFDYVENELIDEYGADLVRNGGLQVHTTIDLGLQRVGLDAMRGALPYSTDPASALVSIDPRNGRVRAMVSSASYDQTQFNLAAQGRRQPGSTFKAFVLTTAIKQGIDPYSTYYTSKPLDLDLPYWGHWRSRPPTRATRARSTCSGRRSPPTTPCSPSSTSTSGPRAWRRRRSRWGSRPNSTASRRRGSAACGSASRRWRWPTPTRRSPPAAPTATRSRSTAWSSPAAGSSGRRSRSRSRRSRRRSPGR